MHLHCTGFGSLITTSMIAEISDRFGRRVCLSLATMGNAIECAPAGPRESISDYGVPE